MTPYDAAARPPSPSSASCAGRWSAASRWRSARRPIGVFLMLRRMSLMGDAMGHAILPGAAIGFLLAGLSLPAMSLGGFVAGLAVALARRPRRPLDHAARGCEPSPPSISISLALGVLIVSVRGSNIDLLHVLFGTVLALDDQALFLVAAIATLTLAGARG